MSFFTNTLKLNVLSDCIALTFSSTIISSILLLLGIFGFKNLFTNNLYGQSCIDKADISKKSKFSEQLKLLQENQVDTEDLQGGDLGGTKDYGDIFGDPNLFKDFGGFDD